MLGFISASPLFCIHIATCIQRLSAMHFHAGNGSDDFSIRAYVWNHPTPTPSPYASSASSASPLNFKNAVISLAGTWTKVCVCACVCACVRVCVALRQRIITVAYAGMVASDSRHYSGLCRYQVAFLVQTASLCRRRHSCNSLAP